MNSNNNKIRLIRNVAALLLCVVAASCSQDDPVIQQGEPLPPGKYPLLLTATVDGMATRAAGKDLWTKGDPIGVRIEGGELGRYKLNADGTIMEFVNAIHWHTTGASTVRAWFPYEPQTNISLADQSKGFSDYDYLAAVAENQSFQNQVTLNFKHQMAKVTCILKQDEGISDDEWRTLKLSIAGHTEASFTEGVLTGTKHDWITPIYDSELFDYEALLVPQDMTGREFIKIDIKVNVNNSLIDKTFIFKPGKGSLQAGNHYKYNITVKKDRLEVQSLSASWKDDGDWHPAEAAVFHVKLPENVTLPENMTMTFSKNVQSEGKYLLVKGNRFTISYEVTYDNMTKGFQISKETGDSDRDIVTRTVTKVAEDKFIYYFNYYLISEEVTLEYGDFVQVGDYYYDNGTWGPLELKGKNKPVGVVFKVGAGGSGNFVDNPDNYNKNLDPIHGYAVALTDATNSADKWGDSGKIDPVPTYGSYDETTTPYTGYNYTMSIKKWGEGEVDNKKHAYNAVKAALDYRTVVDGIELNAPEGKSSGWYLPTPQQLTDIENIPNRKGLFEGVDGKDMDTGNPGRYWSCLVSSTSNAYVWYFDGSKKQGRLTRNSSTSSNISCVRAVLTF